MPRPARTHPVAFPAARFRVLDGATEMAVAEAVAAPVSRPERVTAVLSAIYAEIGGDAVDPAKLRRISSAGREWLLQRAALRLASPENWFEAPCVACGETLDLEVGLDRVPRTAAGTGFPKVDVETSLGPRQFEAPNGGHEEDFARTSQPDPRRVFAALCGLSDTAEADAIRFDEADLAAIDAALEETSPEVADGVDVLCPACGAATRARIEPLSFGFPKYGALLAEIHLIARSYHWAEAEILAMPAHRRQSYANLIRAEQFPRGRVH